MEFLRSFEIILLSTSFMSKFLKKFFYAILGCEILSQLSSAEYAHVIKLIQHAILSTDLAIYFQKRKLFFDLIKSKQHEWKNTTHRELLR